jgi:hypothetical protein
MADEPNGKAVEEKQPTPKRKKPPGYRNFERLLKQVVAAPPLRRYKDNDGHETDS